DLSRDLNRGGNFEAAVREYSRAPSASSGGRLKWVAASELPGPVVNQVLALMPGEVTAPIALGRGISIFKLRDIREEARAQSDTADDTVTYYELIQPLPTNAPAEALEAANELADTVRGQTRLCRDLDDRVAEFGLGSGRSEPTPLGAVPGPIAARIAELTAGDIEIYRDDRGVILLMLCARSGETSPEERDALRRQIFNQRMTSLAQGFLQELRGDAVIVEK
ncbi:MAG: peptidylprolyl isomerase, partial [Pseudomonadota bacterium]